MRITIEQKSYKRKISVEVEDDDLPLSNAIEELVKPALCAIGYHTNNVEDYYTKEEA